MSKTEIRWVQIFQKRENQFQVDTHNSGDTESVILQTEQGAMIEVGAIIGANLLNLKDGDTLEIKLVIHRKEGKND